jgi:hypothetical protein
LLLVLFAAVLIIGCAKDIIVQSPSEIRGYYEGRYQSVTNYRVEGTVIRTEDVLWTFTDRIFRCEWDSSNGNPKVFCDFSGTYALEQNLVFSDTIVEPQTCQHSDIPVGDFTLDRVGDDSLIITQWDKTLNTLKKLSLKKLPQ